MNLIQDSEHSVSENCADDGAAADSVTPTFADLARAAMALIGRSVKGSRRRHRYAVGILVVLSAAGVLGYRATGEEQSTSETSASVGGVGLQSYCQGFDFVAFDYSPAQVVCRSDVDPVAACVREHPDATRFVLQDPGNLKTGSCYDGRGTVLGDIKDMSGYCRDRHRIGTRTEDNPVHAEDIVGQGWQCRMLADVSAACAGQYNDRTLVAEYRDTEWGCYKPE